jgi:hypothetical protein
VKQAVATTEVRPEGRFTDRKIVQNATTGEIEVVHTVTVVPAVVKQGKAYGSTTKFGQRNTPPSTKSAPAKGGKK